jgi:cytochrome c peroxidase
MIKRTIILSLLAIVIILPSHVGGADIDYNNYFDPMPRRVDSLTNPLNTAKVTLGKMLFFDPRLSRSGFISCQSCHNLATGGVDNLPTSIGHGWQMGERNAPTVFNSALLTSLFWDGRAKDLEEQAKGPILNPVEMASTEELVVERIGSMPEYVRLFKRAFRSDPKPVTYDNISRAIAAFERTLLTPSRFDKFLKGKAASLTEDETRGLELFVETGCASCHRGPAVGGSMFKRFDYGEDQGRFKITDDPADMKVFRVASLRNVELTYPYFHDGSVWDLGNAVRIMGALQLGVTLGDREVDYIVSFLKSLTAEKIIIRMPMLPPSNPKTPQPAPKWKEAPEVTSEELPELILMGVPDGG